jgi:hypothetical protein
VRVRTHLSAGKPSIIRELRLSRSLPTNCDHCGKTLLPANSCCLFDRIRYYGVMVCEDCRQRSVIPRPWTFHISRCVRCHRCGTCRIQRQASLDYIERLSYGLLSIVGRVLGGDLYYCVYCRMQFYDRRDQILPAAETMQT